MTYIPRAGQVIEGQHTLDSLYKEYGDIPPFGHGPDQQKIHNKGNGYVRENFPEVDFIQSCHIVEPPVEVVPEIKPFVQEPVRSEERRVEEVRKLRFCFVLFVDFSDRYKVNQCTTNCFNYEFIDTQLFTIAALI